MIDKKTILVLGAGASAPFGFPTGQRLKDLICVSLRQSLFEQLLSKLRYDKDIITSFRKALVNSGRSSVDAFLESRKDFLDIGKTAIATALLPYETTGNLFQRWIVESTKPNPPQKGNWYDLLFGVLSDGVPFDEFDRNKLSIITFNYDRSIEHYLFTSLKNSYNKTDEECGEKLHKIEIIHVHGSLGPLDWQSRFTGLPSVPYDSGLNLEIIKLAAKNIKIIHEDAVYTPEILRARDIILHADRVIFLGFGFHPTNMKRLAIKKLSSKNIEAMGTSQGLSRQRKIEITHLNPNLNETENKLVPKDVYTFLHEHISF